MGVQPPWCLLAGVVARYPRACAAALQGQDAIRMHSGACVRTCVRVCQRICRRIARRRISCSPTQCCDTGTATICSGCPSTTIMRGMPRHAATRPCLCSCSCPCRHNDARDDGCRSTNCTGAVARRAGATRPGTGVIFTVQSLSWSTATCATLQRTGDGDTRTHTHTCAHAFSCRTHVWTLA